VTGYLEVLAIVAAVVACGVLVLFFIGPRD